MDANTQHILIAGGTGFLGQALEKYFSEQGKMVRILTRKPNKSNHVYWDAQHLGEWMQEMEWADVLINLAGKSVNCRYSEKNKQDILSSRIDSTQILCTAITKSENPPKLWLNSSSATTYVHSETQQMTEDEGVIGDDFSMNVCKRWEDTFFQCQLNHTRKVALRTSIVLGSDGGALPMLKRISRFGMGGKHGNGKQFFSWIHQEDFCRALDHIIQHADIVGPVNVTAPHPVRNIELMEGIRRRYRIPFGISQPKWLLEFGAAIIGTETELLLKSRNVVPERLLESGFNFEFETIQKALKNC